MVIILIHRVSSIHNGMDPNDSNIKAVTILISRYAVWQKFIDVSEEHSIS
jgi:hypothetical protein